MGNGILWIYKTVHLMMICTVCVYINIIIEEMLNIYLL